MWQMWCGKTVKAFFVTLTPISNPRFYGKTFEINTHFLLEPLPMKMLPEKRDTR